MSVEFDLKSTRTGPLNFCAALCRGDSDTAATGLKNAAAEMSALRNFLIRHELMPWFYACAQTPPLKGSLAPGLLRELREAHLRQWVENEKMLAEIERLAAFFEKAGCEIIVLKGPFLAERFYPLRTQRVVHDIDLLVRRKDIAQAGRILLAAGYKQSNGALNHEALLTRLTHHSLYRKNGTVVELHWCLAQHFSFRWKEERIWSSKESWPFRKAFYPVLTPEYELVTQILSIFEDIQRGYVKFKSFVDAFMILKYFSPQAKWGHFFIRRREEKLWRISLNVLDLILSVFDARQDFPRLAEIVEDGRFCLLLQDSGKKKSLLNPSPFGYRQKPWAFRLYECPGFLALGGWVCSLPFRLWMYRGDFANRTKHFLRGCLLFFAQKLERTAQKTRQITDWICAETGLDLTLVYNDTYARIPLQDKPWAAEFFRAVRDLYQPKSVIDFGCGTGDLLVPFQSKGITALGLDGSKACLNRSKLLPENRRLWDLRKIYTPAGKYDLCFCLEVGEHLSPRHTGRLIRSLTASSDTIIFSAAPPGQESIGHINLKPQRWWLRQFQDAGFFLDEGPTHKLKTRLKLIPQMDINYIKNVMILTRENDPPHTAAANSRPFPVPSKLSYDAWLIWNVTYACQFDCLYCYFRKDRDGTSLSNINITALLRTLNRTGKIFLINFTGGEPFLIPNFTEACMALSKRHYLGLNSNLISEKIPEFCRMLNPKRVESIVAFVHMEELKNKQLLDRFIRHFLLFKNAGFPIRAKEVAHPSLLSEIGQHKSLLGRHGIPLNFNPFFGEFEGRRYPGAYRDEEIEQFGLNLDDFLFQKRLCNAGYNAATAGPDGQIHPCYFFHEDLGNIYREIRFRKQITVCPLKECACPFSAYNPPLFQKALSGTRPMTGVAFFRSNKTAAGLMVRAIRTWPGKAFEIVKKLIVTRIVFKSYWLNLIYFKTKRRKFSLGYSLFNIFCAKQNEICRYTSLLIPARKTPDARFLIFAGARTGSTLLVQLLDSHPAIHCDNEIFHYRVCFPKIYLHAHVLSSPKSVYGFKILPYQLLAILGRKDSFNFICELIRDGWKVINLTRRNRLEQSVSVYYAVFENRWAQTARETPQVFGPTPIAPQRFSYQMRHDELMWALQKKIAANIPCLELVYEDHLLKPESHQTTCDLICSHLGIAPGPVSSELVKLMNRPLTDMIQNYDEFSRFIRKTPYACFLPETEAASCTQA